MKQFTSDEAKTIRLRAGKRLIDVAFAAGCAPATVRSFELGATVRPQIAARLREAYGRLSETPPPTEAPPAA